MTFTMSQKRDHDEGGIAPERAALDMEIPPRASITAGGGDEGRERSSRFGLAYTRRTESWSRVSSNLLALDFLHDRFEVVHVADQRLAAVAGE